MTQIKAETRGRKPKQVVKFDLSLIKTFKARDLKFDESLFVPFKTNRELDVILSTEGGLMPGTNMMIAGGPGSGKTTVSLDILSCFAPQLIKGIFISGEMDEIGYYKYCKRIPKFDCIETLFLKNYADNAKEVIEHIFDQSWEVVVIDSVAEVLDMVKYQTKMTQGECERWLIELQDKHKKGGNPDNTNTAFINIQQVTKGNDFVGSNKLKHMMDAFAIIKVSSDATERTISFSKNRDCDKNYKINFAISRDDVYYSFHSEATPDEDDE